MRRVKISTLAFWLIVLTLSCLVRAQEEEYVEENVFRKCNQTIRAGHGVIMSPNFPTSTYPNGLHCWWTIIVESDRIVTLAFGHFDVENGVNCQYDRVSVFNGPSSHHPKLGRFCGPFRPGKQVSTSNKMHVSMDTDASNARAGFFAMYESAVPTLATEDSCGGLINTPQGSFHSPDYPGEEYPPSVTCSWNIRTDEGRIIRLNFKEFDIETSNGCKYDALMVYDGWTYSEKTKYIGRFCGNELPDEIVSDGNELFVTFISDASGFGRGFVATYETESTVEESPEVAESEIAVPSSTLPPSTTTEALQPSTTSNSCPRKCSKIKMKSAVCRASYILVVTISDVRSFLTGQQVTVQVVKAFKLGSLPAMSSMSSRITCPNCFKIPRAGNYIIFGTNVTPTGMDVRPGDMVVRYKKKKHSKQMTKLQKRCESRRQRKGRRRAAGKKRREANVKPSQAHE